MMNTKDLCRFLDWDSNFFGRRIARITTNQLMADTLSQILDWCQAHRIDCLYFLCNVDAAQSIRIAEENNFHFMDIRTTLTRQIDSAPVLTDASQMTIRLSVPTDVPLLQCIARASHHGTRFYRDPNFPRALCDSLYATWIGQSCNGYADAVLVTEMQGQPIGYISCHLNGQGMGQIGLVGLSAEVRGRGLAKSLVYAALCWFAERSVTQVTLVTQGRNVPAQRLYQKCGFLTQSTELWYHRWFQSKDGQAAP